LEGGDIDKPTQMAIDDSKLARGEVPSRARYDNRPTLIFGKHVQKHVVFINNLTLYEKVMHVLVNIAQNEFETNYV
jgi:hypothetical protein